MNQITQGLLWPLSPVYGLLSRLDRFVSRPELLGRPVISVGNITWGGTGKTPVVISIGKGLSYKGVRVAVLSRGYGRRDTRRSLIVSDGKDMLASPEQAGDEPVLLARSLPGAAVITGTDRRRSAVLAIQQFSPDVFVLDDGFQHWKAKRDLDIVCINANDPFGNGRLIPSGILREPLKELSRADILVVSNADAVSEAELTKIESTLSSYSPAPLVRAARRAKEIRWCDGSPSTPITQFRGKEIIAFSGLGDNDGFRKMLERYGCSVIRHFRFRDHHWFTLKEIKEILSFSRVPLLTTPKDALRLESVFRDLSNDDLRRIGAVETELYFLKGEELWQKKLTAFARSFSTATVR